MPVTSTPAFAQSMVSGSVQILPADLSNLKTLYVAGANGALIDMIIATSTDTSARDIQFWLTSKTSQPAFGILTSTGTNVSDGDTVTVGTKTYTFKNTLTNVDGYVKIGGTAALSIQNLYNAMNLFGGGVAGTDYALATTALPDAQATAFTATTLTVTANAVGTSGNSIATTESAVTLSWRDTTLLGGFSDTYIDHVFMTLSLPANSGFTSGVSLLSVLDNTRAGSGTAPLGYQMSDANGNKLLRLCPNCILKVKSLATVSAGKALYIRASGTSL